MKTQQSESKKTIVVVANTSWYLFNFRLSLMKLLKEKGYVVLAVAPSVDKYSAAIEREGIRFIPVAMSRKGTNPLQDIRLMFHFFRLFTQEKPDVVLSYTAKPNIYASLVALFFGLKVVNNVAGLGSVFVKHSLLTKVVELLYTCAFWRSYKVFFQNRDDMSMFLSKKIVRERIAEVLPGSGVDTHRFAPQPERERHEHFEFLLVARMLWDKGIGEFVEASRLLREKFPNMRCRLVGFLDPDNPTGISEQQIRIWHDEGVIIYEGGSDDVREFLHLAHCVVLPSYYREGVPRSLLEAASIAKPIITTDWVGCRETVDDGVTGFLCNTKDAGDLAQKMEQVMLLPQSERLQMGMRGRQKMMSQFDESIILQRYLNVIQTI